MKYLAMMVLILMTGTSALAQNWGMGRAVEGWNKVEMCHGCHDMAMRGRYGHGEFAWVPARRRRSWADNTPLISKISEAYRSANAAIP